jgi:polyhydroxyalkanoate synthesis repressor PhaR
MILTRMPAPDSDPSPGRQRLDIRKYPNRRYYDATHSRHLTLEDIRNLVREGHDLTVTDSRTGADITAQVLTQIILELDTPKLESFPVPLLLRVIRANDRLVRDFIEVYFNRAFASYLSYQKQLDERMRHMRGTPGLFSPMTAWADAFLGPFAPLTGETAPPAQPPEPERSAGLQNVISDLQRQVAGLRAELKRSKTARAAARTRTAERSGAGPGKRKRASGGGKG